MNTGLQHRKSRRNLRAAGRATVTIGRASSDIRAIEIGPCGADPFYRDVFGPFAHRMRFGARFGRMLDGVDADDPVEVARDHPAFELVAAD